MKDEDVVTTLLDRITKILEEHTKAWLAHQKHLERLSGEVAELKNTVKNFQSGDSISAGDVEFLASVTSRLKVISSTFDGKV